MRRVLWMISVTGVLAFGGVPGFGSPPARAQDDLYGGSYYPAPGNVYQAPGYYIYYYSPAPGYFYPAPGYFYPPNFRYPVLRYNYGPPMDYAPVPRYSYPAPWYAGRYRPGGIIRFRGRDRGPYRD